MTAGEARRLYEAELDRIERAIRFTCRRNGLSAEEAEEFRGEAHVRLIEDGYAVIQSLEDQEALGAFLGVVVQRFMLDFRVKRWGKWRPSVAARKAGAVGVRLETLVIRDRIDFAQACEILHRNYQVEESRDELYALLSSFPLRHGLASQREVGLEGVQSISPETPQVELERSERAVTEEAVRHCLDHGLDDLDPDDRLLLRMVYVDGQSVARVSRVLGLEQRPLYRRLESIQKRLRAALERAGVSRERFLELLEHRGFQELDLREIFDRYPSHKMSEAGTDPARSP